MASNQHPDIAVLEKLSQDLSNLPLRDTVALLCEKVSPELEARRRAMFDTILARTPPEVLREIDPTDFCGYIQIPEQTKIHVIRRLADAGVDMDRFPNNRTHAIVQAVGSKKLELAAALLAAGCDVKRRALVSNTDTVEQYLDEKRVGDLDFHVCWRARNMLEDERHRMFFENLPAQELLLTPQGRPTWQAQGLATHYALQDMFDTQYARYFGGEQAQAETAAKLCATFAEKHRKHFDIAPILRSAELARPSTSAVVKYARGHTPDVTKEGVA